MFLDYQQRLHRELEKKKSANTLSLRLSQPTPAKLKEECIVRCRQGYSRKDEAVLSSFFGQQADEAAYEKAINKCDKFKPLRSFIDNETSKPDSRVIELLAWLIDFEPRPYDDRVNYNDDLDELRAPANGKRVEVTDKVGEPKSEAYGGKAEETTEVKKAPDPVLQKKTTKRKKIVPVLIICILLCACAYLFWEMKRGQSNEACMYWNNDHYEQISCTAKLGDATIIALDTAKLHHFKRIMNTDTITFNSIGKVWYIKLNDKIECYTSGGNHPMETNRVLKPITDHIIRTYFMADSAK